MTRMPTVCSADVEGKSIIEYGTDAGHAAGLLLPGDLRPRSFRQPDILARRHALLATRPAHMAPLLELTCAQRDQQPGWQVPDFDPCGGGIAARVLFLSEKPGPKTAAGSGSGFLSLNNDDPTAAAGHDFALIRNRLPVNWCLNANVIPWWDGTIKISKEQRKLGAAAIRDLLRLLRDLRAIVLVGNTAKRAWTASGLAAPAGVQIFRSDHPSPLVRARYPVRWAAIPGTWPNRDWLDRVATIDEGDAR